MATSLRSKVLRNKVVLSKTRLLLSRVFVCHSESRVLRDLVPQLINLRRNASSISRLCDRITELEHEADEAYEGYIGYIFTQEEDFREMTKYKNLAELFEKATDSGKHVADCIRIMLLRYSDE